MKFLDRSEPLRELPRFGDLSEQEMRTVCEGTLGVRHHGRQIAAVGPGDLVG